MKILIVDDDPVQAKILVDIFNAYNYCAKGVASVSKALQLVDSEKFDLILSDIRMPVMNGVELCRIVKKSQPSIFFILMTAYANDDLIIEGVRAGALVTLSKPLDLETLLNRIANLNP